jgi:hypothetical protein
MDKVRLHPVEDVAWRRASNEASTQADDLSEEDRNSSYAIHEPRDDETLQLFEVGFEPGCKV